jgi:Ni/Fe-hydrogenase subunit HybB-like protein
MVMIDMGRPDRLLNVFRYARIQSNIIWDVLGVSTYLTGCILYFYIPMIPDLALLADQPRLSPWRRRLYRALSLKWTGTPQQKLLLERAISSMAVFIIPLAVSVHTVVSWIFAMTLRPGWNSSIFGPYFVVGAIYSGAAGVIFSMWVLRRVFHLEDYVEELHFRNLGLLLLAFCLIYLYFNINEYLTAGYKLEGSERVLIERLFTGDYAVLFWLAQGMCVFVPAALMIAVLGFKRYRCYTVPGVVWSSALVIVGAWLKRYIIVVPTLRSPYLPSGQRLPWQWTHYHPTWVEWSITAAAFAGFLLIYTLMAKVFPIVSIWETREQQSEAAVPALSKTVSPRWWKPGRVFPILTLAVVVLWGASARATDKVKQKQPKPAVLTAEWKVLPANPASPNSTTGQETAAIPYGRVFMYAGHIFNPLWFLDTSPESKLKPFPAVAVVAALNDSNGAPISFKPLEFSAKTAFGSLAFGSRPTLADGKAQLVIQDRRYGSYPLHVVFPGDAEYAATSFDLNVNFGPRPLPALPQAGVLITPYATPPIAMSFLFFYGTMWVVFAYVFGYLILWKMRKAASSAEPAQSKAPLVVNVHQSPSNYRARSDS